MSGKRDGFLDVVRALATIRVVLWHAFGAAALTFVAAMPAMFFVTGTLYTGSVDRHGARTTLFDRLRRVGPSLWLFALLAWAAMAIGAWRSGTEWPWARAALWFLPVGDPGGSTWEGGWLATPLWYLRALLWIFLLSPLIIRAVRRWPVASLATASAVVVGLEVVDRQAWVRPSVAPHLVWQVGDIVLYGLFFALGVLSSDGRFRPVTSRQWLGIAAGGVALAGVWWFTQPVPEGIVNNSHPMHLLVGVVWLAVAMAAQGALRVVADHRLSRPVVKFLSQRSLTVYLWHTTAIVGVLWFLNRTARLPDGAWTASYLVLITAGVVLLATAFGWVEDLAARRAPRLWPVTGGQRTPRSVWARVAVPVAVIVAVAVVLPTATPETTQVAFTPRVPSQAPPRPQVADAQTIVATSGPEPAARSMPLDRDALQAVIDTWRFAYAIPGVSVSVTAPDGDQFATVGGVDETGDDRTLVEGLDVMSVTKLFTANLVYRAVDAGLLSLDDPAPSIGAEPEFGYAGQVTVRQLLAHRSGIVNYRDSSRYAADPGSVASVSDAIASSLADPLVAPPGSTSLYSSTNYLLLGRLLEQVTGRDYESLLADELLAPLGLSSATHLGPDPGEPHFATSGLVMDISDLGRAGVALLRDHDDVSDDSYAQMRDIDLDSGMGPGLNGFCPCQRDIEGGVQWFALGYTGGSTLLAYLPDADVVVAIDVTEGLYGDHGHFDAVIDLARRLSDASMPASTSTEPDASLQPV
jgi:CubicO group peptidase (beta-lactamase class C family)/peptidoglycan/LPS O-acetylase OafA/YrhL